MSRAYECADEIGCMLQRNLLSIVFKKWQENPILFTNSLYKYYPPKTNDQTAREIYPIGWTLYQNASASQKLLLQLCKDKDLIKKQLDVSKQDKSLFEQSKCNKKKNKKAPRWHGNK